MSYTPIAAALRAKYGKRAAATSAPASDVLTVEREERAAIAIVDGGLLPELAEGLFALEREPRPDGVSEASWRDCLDTAWRRADQYGSELMANGWTVQQIIAGAADVRASAWLILDGEIVEITPHRIVIERPDGERSEHRRPH